MSAITDPKFKFTIPGATADARRDTLFEGGPLHVSANHWFYTVRKERCIPVAGGGLTIDLHYVEYVFLDVFDWPDGALERGMVWYLLPERYPASWPQVRPLGF